MPLPRACKRCGKRFQPYSPSNKLCGKCRDEVNSEWRIKKRRQKDGIKNT